VLAFNNWIKNPNQKTPTEATPCRSGGKHLQQSEPTRARPDSQIMKDSGDALAADQWI
jgi:hypothetical protein